MFTYNKVTYVQKGLFALIIYDFTLNDKYYFDGLYITCTWTGFLLENYFFIFLVENLILEAIFFNKFSN